MPVENSRDGALRLTELLQHEAILEYHGYLNLCQEESQLPHWNLVHCTVCCPIQVDPGYALQHYGQAIQHHDYHQYYWPRFPHQELA